MRLRAALLAPAALLALAACHRDAAQDARPTAPPPAPAAAAPAPPPVAATPSTAPQLTAEERRRRLRAEKDGEAETIRAPDYEGATSAATALPDRSDNEGPAASSPPPPADAPPQASPPPPPPGQPPG